MIIGDNKFEGRKLSTAIMADALARFADRPVIDTTGLKDTYDFTMEFSPEDFRAMMIRAAIAQGAPVSSDLLKLADAVPVEILIIDEASRTPTEN
jgi:uncharacterized protein (TIGR03435 family)